MGANSSTLSREVGKSEFHDLLQECQGLTRNLEQGVSGLFSSIDMLLSKTQILNDNLSVDKVDDRGSTKEKVHLEKCREAALQLLSAAEGIQYCQKQSTMKSLDRLLKFMQRLNIQMEEGCKKEPFEDLFPGLFMKDIKRRNTRRDEELRTELIEKIEYLRHNLQYAESRTKSSIEECERLKEEKHELVNLNKTMQKQNLQNKEHYENKQMTLEIENHQVQRQLDMLHIEHIEIITRQHEDTKLQLTNEISAITEAQLNKRNTMEDRERTLVSELQHVRAANRKLSNQICEVQHASKENESFITGMKEKMMSLEEENTKLKRLSTKIAQDLEKCTAENETIRNELEQMKSRKVIQIQMYSKRGVGLLASVEDELKSVLKSKMDIEEGVDVDIINCAKVSDFQPDIPLLILCILASGLGTGVANTVRGLTLTPKMAMLIFHHKDAHALPNQASERVLTGHELRSLGGIFDLAFLSGKGIYNCEMNRANFISLVNFIKREGTKRMRNDL